MDLIAAIVLGIALGVTEFLPISSLGHSLVLEAVFNFPQTLIGSPAADIANARTALGLFIQGGAVLAVLVFYRRDLLSEARSLGSDPKARRLWLNVLIAFIPIGVLGLVFNTWIKAHLFQPIVVAIALIFGGVIFLVVESTRRKDYQPTANTLEEITPRQALLIGLAQITALIPGVSRSGSTIIGGLLTGLSREVAASFTFYLFIPTLGSAVLYELFNQIRKHELATALLPYFLVATVVAFVTSLFAIRFLIRFISTHDFRGFGIYRIVIGALIIILIVTGVIQQVTG
jgi:undecaprenyl-diphosphatase